jgi:rhodanese-related sulfurtransferase/uncharacterized membrane protein YedE/YeeE
MYPFPLPAFSATSAENPWTYVVFLVIGFFFGYMLEISGFGNSKKLAAQFYFTDMTVLKVMFGAIVTAMVLIFALVGLGVLDYSQIYVNTTYLWPMIVGGLIMGVGFIVGGFCPGTSLVSMATGKVDGLFFVLGGLFGIFLFGETERFYDYWWQTAGYLGRFTLMDWLNLPAGVVVTIIVFMALFMFWGSEQLERLVGRRDLKREPKLRSVGAGALALGAFAVLLIGQPSAEQKWARVEPAKAPMLAERKVQIHPGELLATIANDRLNLVMLDVRAEADYNLFHIHGAQLMPMSDLKAAIPKLLLEPAKNTVYVVMSNDEAAATEAWKTLAVNSVPNAYILEGGVNNWLSLFGMEEQAIVLTPTPPGDDSLKYTFTAALGDRYLAADPSPHEWELEYTPKIELDVQRDKSGGGCG